MNDIALAASAELVRELKTNSEDTREHLLRSSALKQMARSPAHARHAVLTGWEQTLSMRLGSGTHSLLLGGPPVLCCPTKQRRGKEFDAWLEKQPDDAIVLSKTDYDRAQRMNAAVRANTLASQVLFVPGTIYEKTLHFELLGRALRCTPDARTVEHLVDLKSTRDASPSKFHWDVKRMGYANQSALYSAAMAAVNGVAPRRCYIVAVESKAPFLCTVHLLTAGTLERAQKQNVKWLADFIECERSGKFTGYSDTIIDLDVPDESMELVFEDDEEEETTP